MLDTQTDMDIRPPFQNNALATQSGFKATNITNIHQTARSDLQMTQLNSNTGPPPSRNNMLR